jgi:hypothetical protein
MKRRIILFLVVFVFSYVRALSQSGNNCTNAITIPMDGNCNSYNVSSSTGNKDHCQGLLYGGQGAITYFKFTTDAAPQCVSLNLQTTGGQSIEAMLYTGCSNGNTIGGGTYDPQNMCFHDGKGIWATNLDVSNLTPGVTYYLKVRTESGYTGTIQVCGKFYTPPNNLCTSATLIDEALTEDNNACNFGSGGFTPGNPCASVNMISVAWYKYTVLTDGVSLLNIRNMNCDNRDLPGINDYGFNMFFFTGSCGSLTQRYCYTASGINSTDTSYNVSIPSLTAGTEVYIAIGGVLGSNCSYDIYVTNAAPLSVNFKFFEGWKATGYNHLGWQTTSEKDNQYFEIERSVDGNHFMTIGRVEGYGNSQQIRNYSFDDHNPLSLGYYRLKQVDVNNVSTYSHIVKIARDNGSLLKAVFENPAHDILKLNIETAVSGVVQIQLVDIAGRTMQKSSLVCRKGNNSFTQSLEKLPAGNYYLVLTQEGIRKTYPVVRN